MKGDVDLDLELLQSCEKCYGIGKVLDSIEPIPCPKCYSTGEVPTYDGHQVIYFLEWYDRKKEYERGTD